MTDKPTSEGVSDRLVMERHTVEVPLCQYQGLDIALVIPKDMAEVDAVRAAFAFRDLYASLVEKQHGPLIGQEALERARLDGWRKGREAAVAECRRLAAFYKTMSETAYRIGQVDAAKTLAGSIAALPEPKE